MPSAIEMYRQAYNMDYRQGDWQFAEQLYRRIVDEHPHSNEADYAKVHLERIDRLKGDPHAPDLQPVHPGDGMQGFSIVNFVLLLLLLVAVGFGMYFLYRQYVRQERTDLILQGMLSERIGSSADAIERYKEAQVVREGDALASRYLAESYLRQRKFESAAIEVQWWELADPTDPAVAAFRRRLAKAKAKARKR